MNKYAIFMVDDDDETGEGIFVFGVFDTLEETREWIKTLPEDTKADWIDWSETPWFRHDTTYHIYEMIEVGESFRARELPR